MRLQPHELTCQFKRASQAAEELIRVEGRGFIPGIGGTESKRPSGPEVCFSSFPHQSECLSAACSAPGLSWKPLNDFLSNLARTLNHGHSNP